MSDNPYATAATPTGLYATPDDIGRVLVVDDDERKETNIKRTHSFGSLAKMGRNPVPNVQAQNLFRVVGGFLSNDSDAVLKSIAQHAEYTLARTAFNLDSESLYRATAHACRDRLIEQWNETQQYWTEQDPKRVYYLSLEFLIGRCLQNTLSNLDLEHPFADAVKSLGSKLEEVYGFEKDPALGNGGLGRLAACFLDSLATLDYPAWGYGIRYQYGMFEQHIGDDGNQLERPDFWLTAGSPWEIERLDVTYPVRFYGHVTEAPDGRCQWTGGEIVSAVAYDMPIPGYDTFNVANLRLWAAKPSKEFDLNAFNQGNYVEAVHTRQRAEQISSVLYPNDNSTQGKELRLKQQYFFVSATLRDIVRRFRKVPREWSQFPEKVSVQLNDTHPALGIAELMRMLVDEEGLVWDAAWELTNRTFSYTNHTVLPEALERWSVGLLEHLLPRHMQIIYKINHHFLESVSRKFPDQTNYLTVMSLIEEGHDKKVRMANLAIVGSHTVNGVAEIHSDLIKTTIFKEFTHMFPGKFQNKTNGVTPRRWILGCNSELSAIATKWCETSKWVKDLTLLTTLKHHAGNTDLMAEWAVMKKHCKQRLAAYVRQTLGITIDPSALFDVHIKRIHEYKRQFLNILGCVRRYIDLKAMTETQRQQTAVKRVSIFAGKAAPGYFRAKTIIQLINKVAAVVNNDPETSDYFKVVFIPNYNVSNAEVIIPASDLSEHISTAGMEASGTSNMKFAMNGCLIIGTWDGANVEICHEIGQQHMFMFGTKTQDVEQRRNEVRHRREGLAASLLEVVNVIRGGMFGNPDSFHSLLNSLDNGDDYYIVSVDWQEYIDAQSRVDEKYTNPSDWLYSSIMSTAGSGKFSTDRTIHQYATEIWNIEPCSRPMNPADNNNNSTAFEEVITADKVGTSHKGKKGRKRT